MAIRNDEEGKDLRCLGTYSAYHHTALHFSLLCLHMGTAELASIAGLPYSSLYPQSLLLKVSRMNLEMRYQREEYGEDEKKGVCLGKC